MIFATGTPVSNSMTELYTMQRYLQYDRLQEMGMIHFDCWASRFGETVTALELAPEGKGYRPRTRFSRFFNLPELMNIFREVADIKTADQLHLPVPEVEYHNVAAKPSEVQKELVQELSERAALIHSGSVSPDIDNMLKITSDGRKLGLDQRIINPAFPDDPESKVNLCVGNILQVWRDSEADKLTQLVFCDVSTPQAAVKAKSTVIDPLGGIAKPFTVYEDIRSKLIAQGVPPEQIAFIHDANSEAKKKELFGKVRSGQVRVLLGSTAKMGAGTNVQDRLVAIHDLDCPWRPGDLAQRKGRIERQGNQNEKVHVFRYVTEGTFDAYLWQTVENKQKFISQIMSSKNPVRSCEDVDEVALSFAEIKALCAGDPRIKERMDLDVDVARLKIMKADYKTKQFRLEDSLIRSFPAEIAKMKEQMESLKADMQTLSEHPHPEGGFAGMTVLSDTLLERENAGAALIEAAKQATGRDPVEIGTYRGFTMSVTLENFGKKYVLTMQSALISSGTLTAGKTYTISGYVNTSGITNLQGGAISLMVTDGSKSWTSQLVNYITSPAVDDGWVRISVTFTPDATDEYGIFVNNSGAIGTFYADDLQVEEGDAPSSYNLVANGNMEGTGRWTMGTNAAFSTSYGVAGSAKSLRVTGDPLSASTNAYQDIVLNLPGTQTYVLSGWARANAVPDDPSELDNPNDVTKKCGLRATITYSDGKTEGH